MVRLRLGYQQFLRCRTDAAAVHHRHKIFQTSSLHPVFPFLCKIQNGYRSLPKVCLVPEHWQKTRQLHSMRRRLICRGHQGTAETNPCPGGSVRRGIVKELSRPGRGYSPTARSERKTGMVHSSVAGQQQKGCPPDLSLGRQWNVSPPNTPENTQQPALNASERATGRLLLWLLCTAVCLFSKFRSTKRQNVDRC